MTAMAARNAGSPSTLDAFRLARDRGVVKGSLDAHCLPRVDDLLGDGPAKVEWRVAGAIDAIGRPALMVDVAGTLPLTCQRCLANFEWPVEQRTEVLLAKSERELADLDADSGAEVVLASTPIDPLKLVEDELVLALPFAPRHPDGACVPPDEMTTRRE